MSASDAVILLISDGLVAVGRVLGGFRRRSGWERQADRLAVAEESRECWEPDELWAATEAKDVAEMRSVSDLYVQCSYPMRPNAIAASDCCRGPATSAVDSGDAWYWRCDEHLGFVSEGVEGNVRFAVPTPTAMRSAAVSPPAADNTTEVDHLEAAWHYHRPQANYNGDLVWGCEGCNWGGPTIQAHSRHRFHVLADMKNATTRVQEQLGGTA